MTSAPPPTTAQEVDALDHVLAFDSDGLANSIAAHAGDATAVRLGCANLWLDLLRGRVENIDAAASALQAQASKDGAGATVVEATVLRALASLSRADVTAATEIARRAARMAQAEALPQQEYLAHLTLARVRRHAGRPHLAAHILGAIADAAPPRWHGFVAWELLLAGAEQRAATLLEGAALTAPAMQRLPAVRAARALAQLLDAARAGRRDAFEAAAKAMTGAVVGFADLAGEAAALVAALDHLRAYPAGPPDGSTDVARWRQGATAHAPAGLHGVGAALSLELEAETTVAFVVARPGEPGCRVLPPGLGLAPQARRLDRASPPSGSGARADTGVAVLALAGPAGLPRDEFFKQVYGFPFSRELHQDVLDVLVHRMRQRLGDSGEIARGGDAFTISLSLHQALVVPDTRCALSLGERVLRALARMTRASAQEAAKTLGIAVRTVQEALQELVADGSASAERAGHRVSYRLHDTTFTEVTHLKKPSV